MKVTVNRPVEVEVKFVRMSVAVRYGEDDMPNDFPFRRNDIWDVTIDADTGTILDWPHGISHGLYMKVVDQGSYWLLDADRQIIATIKDDYVPHGVIPGSYGDYVEVDIDSDGRIANWPSTIDVAEFFRED